MSQNYCIELNLRTMNNSIREIEGLTLSAHTRPTETLLPGVLIIKGEVPQHQLAAIYEPVIGFTIRGRKTISIGEDVIHAKAPSYYVIPTDIPAKGLVHQGKNGLPYLSLGLRINQNSLLSLLRDLPVDHHRDNVAPEFSACAASQELLEAWVRMLRLLKTPKDIPALAPVYEREILYRVLIGPQGWRLRQACFVSGRSPGVHRAVQWIRSNFTKAIDVGLIAAKSGMGVTTFHRHFKQITGLSPIQFQKQLRLLEARRLVAFEGFAVANAAYEVGYESPSQFNREYSRFFGTTPARDTAKLREIESTR
jgi:AraC-like DNA-binding protein